MALHTHSRSRGKADRLLLLLLVLGAMPGVNADCHNPLLFTYNTTGTEGLTLVDLSLMAGYVSPTLTNVNVTGHTAWYFDAYQLNVATPAGSETFTLNIYDDTVSQAKVTNSTLAQETKSPSFMEFIPQGYFYNISLKNEDNGAVWVNTTTTQLQLDAICSSHTTYSTNYKTLPMTGYRLGFYEAPLMRFVLDSSVTREQKQSASNTGLVFYLLNQTNTTWVEVDYRLNDYTGQYLTSNLETSRAYSDTWMIIDERQWTSEGENNNYFFRPNTYYRIRVKSATSTEDKGQFKYDANGTQTIKTTTPIITYGTNTLTGLAFSLTSNSTLKRIYCQHAVDAGYSWYSSSFKVYNWSDPAHTLIYSATGATSSTTFTYSGASTTEQYKAVCVVNFTGGLATKTNLFTFNEYSDMFMAPNIVGNETQQHDALGGFSVTEVFKYGSVFLLIFIIGLGSKAVASYILLFFAGVLWLLNTWKWMSIDPLLVGFVIVFAVVFRFVKAKEAKQ